NCGIPLQPFQKRERLVVATALEVVGELGIDWRRQLRLEYGDPLRYALQLLEMQSRVALVELAVGDNGEPFAKRGGEGLVGRNGIRHISNLRRSPARPSSGFASLPRRSRLRENLPFGFDPVLMLVSRQTFVAALLGDEIRAQGDVLVGVDR